MSFVGNITGGLIGTSDAEKAAKNIKFSPFNISGPTGSVSYDAKTKTLSSILSPELMSIMDSIRPQADAMMSASADQLRAATEFDQAGFAKNITDRLRLLSAPKEEQDRLRLESRLKQQGLLTATTGAQAQGELFDAQSLAETMRALQGFTGAGAEQDRLFASAQGLFGTGAGGNAMLAEMLNMPNDLFGASISAGTGDTAALGAKATAFGNIGKLQQGFLSGMLDKAFPAPTEGGT